MVEYLSSPIIVRISRERLKEHGVALSKPYDYVYWRSEYPIDLFISQVQGNLLKKLNEYSKYETSHILLDRDEDITRLSQSVSIFQKFKFRKQISTRVSMKGFDQVIIGTVWEFGFNADTNRNVIRFALDCGLGERNSLGLVL